MTKNLLQLEHGHSKGFDAPAMNQADSLSTPLLALLNISGKKACIFPRRIQYPQHTGMVKKIIQQGRSDFGARSVHSVREHDKMARTPLVAFFNIPLLKK